MQTELFPAGAGALAQGFHYQPDLIGADEEQELAAWIATLPLRPFEFRGFLGSRRVTAFGSRYDYSAHGVREAPPLPGELLGLRLKAAQFAGCAPEAFAQALVTEYRPGAPIGWHRDKPHYDIVAGISLLAPATLRLRRRQGGAWERKSQLLAPRSVYLLSGEARHEWEHSIPPQPLLRYSVTFRTEAPAQ